jgi:Ca-activated chloride channel homolog
MTSANRPQLMLRDRSQTRCSPAQRRGTILVLTALMIPVLFILSAFVINIAYLQLSKTELMVATDAAARTASRALSEYQSVELAKEAARATAAMNTVAGAPLRLDVDKQLQFGLASNQYQNGKSSRFSFSPVSEQAVMNGSATANAVQLVGVRASNSEDGEVKFPFPAFTGKHSWNLSHSAQALHMDRDVALVLDRSGSMAWRPYEWPTAHGPWHSTIYAAAEKVGLLYSVRVGSGRQYYYSPGVTQTMYQDWVWTDYYKLGALPPTLWDELKIAVNHFLNVMQANNSDGYIGLASYATDATLDLPLQKGHNAIRSKLNQLMPVGATAIGLGIQQGAAILLDPNVQHPLSVKTMIVMTDGIHNTGIDPLDVAASLVASHNITIHTVTFSVLADQERMKQLARIGRGRHYHAATGAELISVFREIAYNLPTLTIE